MGTQASYTCERLYNEVNNSPTAKDRYQPDRTPTTIIAITLLSGSPEPPRSEQARETNLGAAGMVRGAEFHRHPPA